MKLCRDCKHRYGIFSNKCRVAPPPRWHTNKVTGEDFLVGNNSCEAQRFWLDPGYCGPEGKNWEANDRNAWWQRFW